VLAIIFHFLKKNLNIALEENKFQKMRLDKLIQICQVKFHLIKNLLSQRKKDLTMGTLHHILVMQQPQSLQQLTRPLNLQKQKLRKQVLLVS
jgi:hypothetical protein